MEDRARRVPGTALHAFVERTRRGANHDLRAPLAAIVNYAAALEEGCDPQQLRPTTQRIRHHALQAAEMLQALLEATGLAARPAESLRVRGDPLEIVKATILDGGFDDLVELRADGAVGGAGEPLEHDAELARYAMGAFLALECSARTPARRPLGARVVRAPGSTAIELSFASDRAAAPAPVELEVFVQGYDEEAPRAARFALGLARELCACYRGELAVAGRAGQDALLRIVQPTG